jgi:hypothetical protein
MTVTQPDFNTATTREWSDFTLDSTFETLEAAIDRFITEGRAPTGHWIQYQTITHDGLQLEARRWPVDGGYGPHERRIYNASWILAEQEIPA